MIAMTSELRSKPGEEAQVLRIGLALARRVREEEPGCHGYSLVRSRHDPRLFLTFERYEDDAALAEHSRTAHFKQAFDELMERLEEPPRVAIFDLVTA
jgi:quinol monooxygenase YgiN